MPCRGPSLRSWRRSVVIDERRRRAELVDAAGVESFRIERLDEMADEAREAAAPHDVVALSFRDEEPSVREVLHDRLAVARRRDRIELAFEHEHRLVALQRLVEIGRARAARPELALRADHADERIAENQF